MFVGGQNMNSIFKKFFSVAFSMFFMIFASFPAYCSGGPKKIDEEKKPRRVRLLQHRTFSAHYPEKPRVQCPGGESYSLIMQKAYENYLASEKEKYKNMGGYWFCSDSTLFKSSDLNFLFNTVKRICFESGSVAFRTFKRILNILNINGIEGDWKKEIYPLICKNGMVIEDSFKLILTNRMTGKQLVFYFKFGDVSTTRATYDFDFNTSIDTYNKFIDLISSLNPESPLKMRLKRKMWYEVKDVVVQKKALNLKSDSFTRLSNLKVVDILDDLVSIYGGAFDRCTDLKKINFHGKVQSIERLAFRNCFKLEEIDLPEGLRFIGKAAFEGCGRLKKITIPLSTEIIYSSAFDSTPEDLKIMYGGRKYSKKDFVRAFLFTGGLMLKE